MPEPEDLLRYACEDQAWQHYLYAGPGLYQASIAVSLKRIADRLDDIASGEATIMMQDRVG